MINTLRDIKINAIDATVLQEMISQDNLKIFIVRQGVEFKLILSLPPPWWIYSVDHKLNEGASMKVSVNSLNGLQRGDIFKNTQRYTGNDKTNDGISEGGENQKPKQ